MNVGELTATFDLDVDESGFAEAEAQMEELRRGADGRLRDLRGRFVSESRLMGRALSDGIETGTEAVEALDDVDVTIDVEVDATDAEAGIAEVEVDLDELRRRTADTAASIRRDMSAALRRLPTVRIDADSTPLDEQLVRVRQSLRDLAAERVGITVTTEEAGQRLAALTAELESLSREHPSPSVNLGVRQAAESIVALRTRLAELSGESVDIQVNLETAHAREEIAEIREETRAGGDDGNRFSRILASIGDVAGPIGSVAGRFAMVAGAIGGTVPLVAGLWATLVSIAPAAGVAATGLLMVASAGAAIKIGASGIGGAIKAAFADAPAAGGGAAGAMNQVASAQRAVKDAVESAAYANAQAVQRVTDAERNLSDAQKAAKAAQDALTDARRQAAQDLEDLNDRLTDSALGQRSAVLRVQDAQENLNAVMANTSSTEKAKEEAKLAFDEAVQHLKEQGTAYDRLTVQVSDANKAGVDGAQKVVAAQDKVASAQRTVGDQTRAVQDAQTQQTRTAAQGAEQVQKAIEALHQAGAGAASGGVDPLAAALAKLSPNARAFVQEIIGMKGALSGLKLDVQQALFEGLAGSLGRAAGTVLPVLRTRLTEAAAGLNGMAKGVLDTAGGLAESGTLGRALGSANKGLSNLSGLPSVFLQGLVQVAAAAGPAFERITGGLGGLLAGVSQKMSAGLSSGGMSKAIDMAVSLIGQLGTVVGNVGQVIGSVFGAAQQTGGSYIATLVKITDAMAKAFSSPAVQSGLQALFGTMSVLASTVAPLLGTALGVLGPVLAALGPPVQTLITALGAALQPILVALGPVLLAAAKAVGAFALNLGPLLGLVGTLTAALLPILTPLLDGIATILTQLSPVVAALASALAALLAPILAQLPALITPFVTILTTLTGALLPVLTQLITQLPLAQLGQSFADIAVALAPVLAQLAVLLGDQLRLMMPLLTPIITAVSKLATIFVGEFAQGIQQVVVPALRMVTQLLSGDLSGAVSSAGDLLAGIAKTIVREFVSLPVEILRVVVQLGSDLYDAGARIISQLIDGIKSKLSAVKSAASGVVSSISDFFPHSPAKTGPFSGSGYPLYSGQAISAALAEGILGGQGRVRAATASLMAGAQGGLAALGVGPGGPHPALAGAFGGGGVHIENFNAAGQSPDQIAQAFMWHSKGRG